MPVSLFELFSIGIGPSSSHTVGPMRAALRFARELESFDVHQVSVELYGSLAMTGIGHGTDRALLLGLEGYTPEGVDPDAVESLVGAIYAREKLSLLGKRKIDFSPASDLIFCKGKRLPYHSNAMRFTASNREGKKLLQQIFYSVGGGFIVSHEEIDTPPATAPDEKVPYPFATAAELLAHCEREGKRIDEIMLENEKSWREEEEVRSGILRIWAVMQQCVARGISQEGILPGGLEVKRRAAEIHRRLAKQGKTLGDPSEIFDWISLFALAVNEENGAGGRVVTAPTNGAAGVIPATLHYYVKFAPKPTQEGIIRFFLTAAAIGILYKERASLSAAEMGCQGEVGVACSMAAGGLAAALGGTNAQIENAAEIGMEHNLGLTCDPVGGLVQIPCIERNTMGAIKAVNAARLALSGNGQHRVSLDQVIAAMRETGENMKSIYKETSEGGLAAQVQISVGAPAC